MQKIAGNFKGKSILSIDQFSDEDIQLLFNEANTMASRDNNRKQLANQQGRIITNLFYEASTRTSSSFEAAMKRLGGEVLSITNVNYSSVSKGESLGDTVRTLAQYSDAIVLRHSQQGAAIEADRFAGKPIINAGDGAGEHPTQAILDLYTIQKEQGRLDGLKVALVGDLQYGRTVHSLAKLLSGYNTELTYIAPEGFCMPEDITDVVSQKGSKQRRATKLQDCVAEQDVVYMTRIQTERITDPLPNIETLQADYRVTPSIMDLMNESASLMHPLPRVGEIDPAVDNDPRAAYFRQVQNGLHIRMALLNLVLGHK
ncbi:aspartate carbamoyltransferase [Candidatus Saccharibacteria bacterium]|nr:aspartate carbamoyltransferase [Candidatus Saccharibacteria bacterium]